MAPRRGLHDAGSLFALAPASATPAPATPVPGAEGHRARLRRRLLEHGAAALPDHELLEMVLFLALPRRDTKPVARAILARFGGFAEAIAAPDAELRQVEGLGEGGVAALRVVQGAAIRLAARELRDRPLLDHWDKVVDYLAAALAREPVERFRVLFLDARNRLIADECLGAGTLNHAPVYPREVVRRALALHAAAIVLAHNHPSGDPSPSPADIATTREVRDAAATLGIALHDHVIVARGGVASLRALGLI